MPSAAAKHEASKVFAANRARGGVSLAVMQAAGVTRTARVREHGSLRVRFPHTAADMEAVLVNTAGGMAGGDRFEVSIDAGTGARLSVTTTAAEKVYRSLGPDTELDVALSVGVGATLAWLPQETILFDGACLRRTIEADLADDARLILAEAMVFGRTGMGESVDRGQVLDRWNIRRAGKLIHAEATRLDGEIAAQLVAPAAANGGVAVATLLAIPGDDALVARVRSAAEHLSSEIGASTWNGIAAVRLVAPAGGVLRRDLVAVLEAMQIGSLPRLWLN